ncbi:UDP-glucose/GDP-mannose dehydrogenase family protein [Candidatus Uhrbacteria bacterium]|nr:MAG: UDP-glucose/GDP-mannose dehydrogenase family protein [Candidatus Uhrbacteria bacterium]
MNVAVIGTGYVGLVSGACLAELGHRVTCVDVDPAKIEKLRQGVMPIYEPGLEELVKRNVANGRLSFTTQYEDAVPEAEFVSIAVGTPSAEDGSADLQYVFKAAEMIGKYLKRYAVVADKSTVPVGTAERVGGIIRSVYSGEFDVISNPEILREGHAVSDFLNPTRIIIGSPSERAADVALKLYSFLDCPKLVMSPRSAELTKYAANAFLATKISYINEIAHLAEELGADIEEVAAGIGSDPRIGKDFLRAGLGWGGSCFPKDVRAIRHTASAVGHDMPIVSAALEMNARAKQRVVSRIENALGDLKGKRVALLGLSFKNNTDDTRESAALELARRFLDAGASVSAFDPAAVIYDADLEANIDRKTSAMDALHEADALILATEWDEFRSLDLAEAKQKMKGNLIMDARNLLDPEQVKKFGFVYLCVGRS